MWLFLRGLCFLFHVCNCCGVHSILADTSGAYILTYTLAASFGSFRSKEISFSLCHSEADYLRLDRSWIGLFVSGHFICLPHFSLFSSCNCERLFYPQLYIILALPSLQELTMVRPDNPYSVLCIPLYYSFDCSSSISPLLS